MGLKSRKTISKSYARKYRYFIKRFYWWWSCHGCKIDGKLIYSPNDISKLILKRYIINTVCFAKYCKKTKLKNYSKSYYVKIARRILRYLKLQRGKIDNWICWFRDRWLTDRVEVELFQSLMEKNIFHKTILVTGSGGSIEVLRQIIRFKPRKLLIRNKWICTIKYTWTWTD